MYYFPDRKDVSDTLIHLTGDRGDTRARDALYSILEELNIHGSGKEGFVKGERTAACFTEAPFSEVQNIIKQRRNTSRPYGPYGVMVRKLDAWEQGARPVLYLPDEEGTWIPREELWRHVRFEYPNIDFTHEREWRCPEGFNLASTRFTVLVRNNREIDELFSIIRNNPDEELIFSRIEEFRAIYTD